MKDAVLNGEVDLAEDLVVEARSDEAESVILPEVESKSSSVLELEDAVTSIPSEEVLEGVVDGQGNVAAAATTATAAIVEEVVEEQYEAEEGSASPSETEVKDREYDENAEKGNEDADLITHSEEAEQSASDDALVGKSGEESVAIEDTEVSDGADSVSAEVAVKVVDDLETLESLVAWEEIAVPEQEDLVNHGETTMIAGDVDDMVTETFDAVVDRSAAIEVSAVAAEEETPVIDNKAAPAVVDEAVAEVDETLLTIDSLEATRAEASAAGDEANEPLEAEATTEPDEEVEISGFASTVNEVLARLVEPFEAAKTMAPEAASEGEPARLGETVRDIRCRGDFAKQLEADGAELERLRFCHDSTLSERDWREKVVPSLRVFRQEFGHCDASSAFIVHSSPPWPNASWGMRLGKTVQNIRNEQLGPSRNSRELLDDLGFVWNSSEAEWSDRTMPAFKAYRQLIDHCRVPPTLLCQQSNHGQNRHGERYLKMLFVQFVVARQWSDRILPALKSFRRVNGHCRVPQKFVVPSDDSWPEQAWGMKLESVVNSIRHKEAYSVQISHDKLQLEQLGFVWDFVEAEWSDRIMPALESFRRVNGHWRVPQKFVVPCEESWPEQSWGMKLGSVVNRIRHKEAYCVQVSHDKLQLEQLGSCGTSLKQSGVTGHASAGNLLSSKWSLSRTSQFCGTVKRVLARTGVGHETWKCCATYP
ncbi:unnamed protein product [Phytophthora lilii]|uniref:Unnamed protein product n=1 Tax=Phytophthora lilii TaxID=2077276 RepID=A0A9W7CUQ9_9STRA|nr:unnamed protein product [Phytophthora lilii]